MEDNKRETPFVYNLGDRLKYIHGKGEMITVVKRYHQYNKETDTTRNIYLLTIENYEGYGYTTQKYASEKHMMANMRRVYSPKDPKAFLKKEFNVPKDIITEAFDFTAKYMKCREDDYVTKEFFIPEDFEERSHDALSCGYYKALEEENEKLKRFYSRLNEENKELKEINNGLRRQLDIRDSMLDKESISYKQWTDTMDENKKLKEDLVKAENAANDLDKRIKHSAKLLEAEQLRKALESAVQHLKAEREDLKKENEKLKNENKMVNGENEALKRENEELREINEGLARSYENAKKENEKLWIDNKKLSCAEKQLDEAAKRIYEAREHLSVILYNK